MLKNFLYKVLLPNARTAKVLLGIFILAHLLLKYLDVLQPIQDFLESDAFSFHLGVYHFTLLSLVEAILVLFAFFWIIGILTHYTEKWIYKIAGIKTSNKALIAKITHVIIYIISFAIALKILGIGFQTLAIFGGAVGIGLGFGLQKITSNFISGIILLSEQSVEPDDLIELEDGTLGYLRRTRARYSLIETFEGKEVMVPNENFIINNVTNLTFRDNKGRVSITIGVSYSSDLELVQKLMLDAANEHPRCICDPAAACFLTEFGDNSVNFLLLFWVGNVKEGRFGPQNDVMFSIWNKFKEHNIEIPFPQRVVTIANTDKEKF